MRVDGQTHTAHARELLSLLRTPRVSTRLFRPPPPAICNNACRTVSPVLTQRLNTLGCRYTWLRAHSRNALGERTQYGTRYTLYTLSTHSVSTHSVRTRYTAHSVRSLELEKLGRDRAAITRDNCDNVR